MLSKKIGDKVFFNLKKYIKNEAKNLMRQIEKMNSFIFWLHTLKVSSHEINKGNIWKKGDN